MGDIGWIFTLSHFLVLVMAPAAISVVDNLTSISCTEAQQLCKKDRSCSPLYKKMDRFCDRSAFQCETPNRPECEEVLQKLQTSSYFRSCMCPPKDSSSKQCHDIQSRIFLHKCVAKDNIKSSDLVWASPPHPVEAHRGSNEVDPFDHEDYDVGEDVDEVEGHKDPERQMSCIGRRKLCLMDDECHKLLKDYRLHCREAKKLGTCTTKDWEPCYRTIQNLKQLTPLLFTCECNMKREDTKQRCERIQSRISKNHCLIAAPYFIHTAYPLEMEYADLRDRVMRYEMELVQSRESTCIKGFLECDSQPDCGYRFQHLLKVCKWNTEVNACQKSECLAAIREFFLLLRPEVTQSLLFCTCAHGDTTCDMVKSAIRPTCSVVDIMPPTCTDLYAQCKSDTDCRSRFENYEKYCSYDPRKEGCSAGVVLCRNAISGIQGTLLTTNCTCETVPDAEKAECMQEQHKIQQDNLCTRMAQNDFHSKMMSTIQTPHADELWSNDGVDTPQYTECRRAIGKNFPPHFMTPIFTRNYTNGSDCSEICHCQRNGTLLCKRLPCLENLVCKFQGKTYERGVVFNGGDRGKCRCIKSEVVCAKSRMEYVPGLFLHVGYSISEQYLIEANTPMVFEPAEIQEKLATLLNGDQAQQFCTLTLHLKNQGNLIFQTEVARAMQSLEEQLSSTLQDPPQACIEEAKLLSYNINIRDRTILSDAQLSLIKIAQLEAIHFHNQDGPPISKHHQPLAVSPSDGCPPLSVHFSILITALVISLRHQR